MSVLTADVALGTCLWVPMQLVETGDVGQLQPPIGQYNKSFLVWFSLEKTVEKYIYWNDWKQKSKCHFVWRSVTWLISSWLFSCWELVLLDFVVDVGGWSFHFHRVHQWLTHSSYCIRVSQFLGIFFSQLLLHSGASATRDLPQGLGLDSHLFSAAQWLKWLQSLACQTPLGARQLFSIPVVLSVRNTFCLKLAGRQSIIEKIYF